MAKQNTKLAEVFHFDLQGKREDKYDFLNQNSLSSIEWNTLEPNEPYYFLVNKNNEGLDVYEKGFKIDEFFNAYGMGITTGNDQELVDFKPDSIKNRFSSPILKKVYYRLFDTRFINYDAKIIERGREKLMFNFINKDNIGLLSLKGVRNNLSSKFGITKLMIDKSIISTLDNGYVFPLYLYPAPNAQQTLDEQTERTPNLNPVIVQQIADKLGMTFTYEKDTSTSSVSGSAIEPVEMAPIDLLDYIYAVLHSPTYREKYKEFLKIDFPRVPYPKDKATFWQLVKLGSEIRQIHLLESPTVEQHITQYPVDGDNMITKPHTVETHERIVQTHGRASQQIGRASQQCDDGALRVYINDAQYFDNVPAVAWNFYIGGYQPAQKWLKDRKGRKLDYDDIFHYQKIIVALTETDRLMKEIDKIEFE